jgi:trafficking protein particle complex subunit 9
MSFVDFSQRAEDHTKILILVHQINSTFRQKNFSRIFERVARLHTLTIPMTPPRVVRMRYRKYYAMENNSWGDFQVHRRVMGLLSVAQCEKESDLAEIFRQHEQQKVLISVVCFVH